MNGVNTVAKTSMTYSNSLLLFLGYLWHFSILFQNSITDLNISSQGDQGAVGDQGGRGVDGRKVC